MASPFAVLLSSKALPYQAELALGLNAILGQRGGEAVLSHAGWSARYTSESIELDEVSNSSPLTVVCKPRMSRGGKDCELKLLDQCFRWCPISVKINGLSLPDPTVAYPGEGLQIFLKNPAFPILTGPDLPNRLVKTVDAPFSALIRVGRFLPRFRIVSLGREYLCSLPWSFSLPGWQLDVTVASNRFKKDLSQQSILANEHYRNLLSALRVQLEKATELLLTHVPPCLGSESLVDDLVEHLFQTGQRETAYGYQKKLTEYLALREPSLAKGMALFRMGLLESAAGQGQGRVQLAQGLLHGLPLNDPLEPQWSMLKAEMAFAPTMLVESQVQGLVYRADTPERIKEHCYRWLVAQRGQDALSRAWHRLSLAGCAYRAGRLEEAGLEVELADQEAAPFGSEDFKLQSVELRAKIAAEAGHLEKSLELFGRHLSMLRQTHGQYDLRLGLTLRRLATLLEHVGQKKQAREYLAWSKRLHGN
jgi:tetratricopeptide (TPR) repeat protein